MLGTRLFHFLMACTYCTDYRLSSSCTCMAEEKCSFMYGACGNFRRPLEAQPAVGLRELKANLSRATEQVRSSFLVSYSAVHQSRKAMTSVLTSSKIAMNLPLLLLILTTFQENLGLSPLSTLNKTSMIRSKRYATHLNPIYRHFDFLKRDGN